MDIGDILSSLSAEDMQALQGIAASLTGSAKQNTASSDSAQPTQASDVDSSENTANVSGAMPSGTSSKPPSSALGAVGGFDMKAFSDMAGIMSKLNSTGNDPRCQLIASLKPMLSPERQQRADEAMRIIKLLDLLPMLKDSGILKGVLGQ